jgi:hypothetical protein
MTELNRTGKPRESPLFADPSNITTRKARFRSSVKDFKPRMLPILAPAISASGGGRSTEKKSIELEGFSPKEDNPRVDYELDQDPEVNKVGGKADKIADSNVDIEPFPLNPFESNRKPNEKYIELKKISSLDAIPKLIASQDDEIHASNITSDIQLNRQGLVSRARGNLECLCDSTDLVVLQCGDDLQHVIVDVEQIIDDVEQVIDRSGSADIEEENCRLKTGTRRDRLRGILKAANNDPNDNEQLPGMVSLDEEDDNKIIRFLYKGRVYGYPHSSGTTLSNYFHFVRNNHPLLAIFFSHRLHPFTKKRRLIVFFCVLCIAYTLSVVLLSNFYFDETSICSIGCLRYNNSTAVSNACHCLGGSNGGRTCESYDMMCQHWSPTMLSAISALILVVYGSFLQFVSSCGCLQGIEFVQSYCICCKNTAETLGGYILSFFAGNLNTSYRTIISLNYSSRYLIHFL